MSHTSAEVRILFRPETTIEKQEKIVAATGCTTIKYDETAQTRIIRMPGNRYSFAVFAHLLKFEAVKEVHHP